MQISVSSSDPGVFVLELLSWLVPKKLPILTKKRKQAQFAHNHGAALQIKG